MLELDFYKGKRVLVTGHTGFKGSWLCRILARAGAIVAGYSLEPPTNPNLYELAGIKDNVISTIEDIRQYNSLSRVFDEIQPEIVFHLAAQPIVRNSYKNPVDTYEINVMGTVNILECIRLHSCVRSFVNVTTDKVYLNREWIWGYREDEYLNGFDPYSNSKSCSELVTHSYCNSFFTERNLAVSTARAGNVIGGGDFAADRIIPDCIRAVQQNTPLIIRNPNSTRPYQHVLEPVFAYLMIAQRQYEEPSLAGCYNIGPDDCDCIKTQELVELFSTFWGKDFSWEIKADPNAPHEATFLKLDNTKLKTTFAWHPVWNIQQAVENTVAWTRAWLSGGNVQVEMDRQIQEYLEA